MIEKYYGRRAQEYEQIYHRNDPVRQNEQAAIVESMKTVLLNRTVLEIACGTGYWTQFIAQTAKNIVATDMSSEMLEIAREKELSFSKVEFFECDAYNLTSIHGSFDAGLANFWFSHIPKADIAKFLSGLHRKIGPSAVVFMADNVYVPGVGGESTTHLGVEDTFKLRELSDGSKHEILKNYYSAEQLYNILASCTTNLTIHIGKCFWWLSYNVPA